MIFIVYWATKLFTFQWQNEKQVYSFFLGPGLDSILPCKSNNRNEIIGKKYGMKNSILFEFNWVSLQIRAYIWP